MLLKFAYKFLSDGGNGNFFRTMSAASLIATPPLLLWMWYEDGCAPHWPYEKYRCSETSWYKFSSTNGFPTFGLSKESEDSTEFAMQQRKAASRSCGGGFSLCTPFIGVILIIGCSVMFASDMFITKKDGGMDVPATAQGSLEGRQSSTITQVENSNPPAAKRQKALDDAAKQAAPPKPVEPAPAPAKEKQPPAAKEQPPTLREQPVRHALVMLYLADRTNTICFIRLRQRIQCRS